MLLKGCVDRDPLQMLYELLDSHAVVKNADPAKNFEDKYILRFYKRIKSLSGRVEGELTLNIPRDLRALYAAPFSAEEAAKDPECVKKLNDCCYEWIQSVEKVLKDITKDPNAEVKKEDKKDELLKKEEEPKKFVKAKEIVNEVLQEINRWVCIQLLFRVLPIISVSFFREINLLCYFVALNTYIVYVRDGG